MTTSRLRIAAAGLILAALALLATRLVPIYLRHLEFQRFVEQSARSVENRTRPDDLVRVQVLQKAAALGLPVRADNVHIRRSDDELRIEVRYVVRVDLPLYTVDLHFYPGAGRR